MPYTTEYRDNCLYRDWTGLVRATIQRRNIMTWIILIIAGAPTNQARSSVLRSYKYAEKI